MPAKPLNKKYSAAKKIRVGKKNSAGKELRVAETPNPTTANDKGFTLVELIVAISVFSIFLTIFVAGVVQLTKSTYAAAARMESSRSIGMLYQRVDPTVRFAEEINTPGVTAGGRVYIEYYTSAETTADVRNYCTQLRYDPHSATLAMRRWSWAGAGAHQDPGPTVQWQNLATEVLPAHSGAAATYPFTRTNASIDTPFQRLVIDLSLGVEAWGSETTSTNTFIARNSSMASITNGGGVVCNGGGTIERP